MAINNLFAIGPYGGADPVVVPPVDLLVEGGGTFRIGTAGPLSLGILQGQIGGNYDLVTRGGTVLAIASAAPDGNPPGSNQLFAFSGGTWNVCLLSGGIVTLVSPNPNT